MSAESERIALLEHRANRSEDVVDRVEVKLDRIVTTLDSLVRIEERQIVINTRLNEGTVAMALQSERISRLEVAMPGLKELRAWVITGVLSGIGMMGASLIHLILK